MKAERVRCPVRAVRIRCVRLGRLVCAVVLLCAVLPGDGRLFPRGVGMPGASAALAAPADAAVSAPVVSVPAVRGPIAPVAPVPVPPGGPLAPGAAVPAGATAHPASTKTGGAVSAPGEPSLSHMIGQMLMVGFRGEQAQPAPPRAAAMTGLGTLLRQGTANATPTTVTGKTAARRPGPGYGVNEVLADIAAGRVGGVILFDRDVADGSPERNVRSPEQVRALSAALQSAAFASPVGLPLFVAVDQEGGRVQRLKPERGFTRYPSARQLGQGTVAETRLRAVAMGRELADIGVNLNFAPVADVDVNPDSPAIGRLGRAYSRDPRVVAAHAAAFINGMAQAGVVSCLKHFPGHGSARSDSHLGVTDVSATRRPEELWPYRALLRPAGSARNGWGGMVMIGHLYDNRLDAAYPATLSRPVITELLRRRMGWGGVVITDDLQMGAITDRYPLEEVVFRAVDAGADILLFGNNLRWQPELTARVHATLTDLVRTGRIPEDRIRQSYQRIARLKALLRMRDAAFGVAGLAVPEVPEVPEVPDTPGTPDGPGAAPGTGDIVP